MAFVDDDQVEEVRVVLAVELLPLLSAHERIVDREKHGRVLRHKVAALVNCRRRHTGKRIIGKPAEVDEPLIGENVAVRQE